MKIKMAFYLPDQLEEAYDDTKLLIESKYIAYMRLLPLLVVQRHKMYNRPMKQLHDKTYHLTLSHILYQCGTALPMVVG